MDGVTCNNVKCRNISRGYLTYVPTEHGWCCLSLSKNWVVASTPPTTSDNDKWSSHYFPYATPHHHHLTWLQRSWWTPGYLTTRKQIKSISKSSFNKSMLVCVYVIVLVVNLRIFVKYIYSIHGTMEHIKLWTGE